MSWRLGARGTTTSVVVVVAIVAVFVAGVVVEDDVNAVDIHVQLEVEEEKPVGSVVGVIPTKRGFTYRLSEDLLEFNLNATSGVITTGAVLDRESMKSDKVDIVVLSSQPTYLIEVTIHVLDVNDNAPTFPEPKIQVTFAESASPGTRVMLDAADDKDVGNNSVSEYKIVSGNAEEKFRLIVVTNPSGETPYLNLETIGTLDREVEGFYTLNITASDGGQPPLMGLLTVEVTILDVNDNPPIFDHSDYVVSVNESVQLGTSVLKVHATDNDADNNARLTYYLSDMEMQFSVDPEEGVIRTQDVIKCPQNCPTPTKCTKSCVFTVFAHDHGSPRQDGRAYVTVNLLDSNDNDPHITFRFNPPSVSFGTVDENAQNGTIVAAVSVVDPDDGPSGQTMVSIVAGNELGHFRIDRNQDVDIVRVNSLLDREKIGKYNLTIVASDKGSPPRTSSAHLIIVVNDVNDHEPVFDRMEYLAVLRELVSEGTFVASILATDQDSGINSNVYYAIASGNENDWFKINAVTGLVTTKKTLDREVQSVVNMKISARDGGPNPRWAFTMLRVEIVDENDQIPTFSTPVVNVSVTENQGSSVLVKLNAVDNDQGPNGSVRYSLAKETAALYPGVFAVDPQLGNLKTLMGLDREVRDRYVVKVVASDLGQPPKSSSAVVNLKVIDENDNSPAFYPVQYLVYVKENTVLGTPVVQVVAEDADEGVNGRVTYEVTSGESPFVVASDTGIVELKKRLEKNKTQYRLIIAAKDGGNRKTAIDAVVDVVVLPKDSSNNVQLEFSQSEGYVFAVQENVDVGTEVGRVSAFSQESKGSVKYSIISGDPLKVFEIDENSGVLTTGHRVDREERSRYSLTVLARLDTIYGKVVVNVTVMDVNDNPPTFTAPSVDVHVTEDTPKGHDVYLAKSFDVDEGINSQVTYNLSGHPAFRIGRDDGMIYLAETLDYEDVKEYQVEVFAQDSGNPRLTSKMNVKIIVDDVNDHCPVFEHVTYETSVLESTPVNTRFHALNAKDADSGRYGKIEYKIVENNDVAFGIFPDGQLYVKSKLDRETRDYYQLTILASDGGDVSRTSTATVIIYVMDENDNSPVFTNVTFNFTLSENEPPDTFVGRLLAEDRDIGRNAELTYSISTNQLDLTIDPKNGFIKSTRTFDREKLVQSTGREYVTMEVVVSDNGIVRRREEARVNVLITDVNDNSPVFLREPYKASMSEGAGLNAQVIRVTASDLDQDLNGKIVYSLVDANDTSFKIDVNTGQIVLRKMLDRETISKYTLTVIAMDSGKPRLSASTTIDVDVLDENDNAPQFENPPESASVAEDTPANTELMRFVASDADTDVNADVSFSIVGGNLQETFRMDSSSGILYLEKTLDFETTPSYHLTVMVIDGGSPRLSSTTVVKLNVLDVNDNAPSLAKMPATRKIKEGLPLKSPVINVTAEDADSGVNGRVVYKIESQEPIGDHFEIDHKTGLVYTSRQIDREFSATYRLRIVATDQAMDIEKRLSTEKTLTIFVEDVNDNAPVFVSLDAVVVPKDAEKGSLLMTCSATDNDAYENGQVAYEMVPAEFFSLDRASGNLYLKNKLNHDVDVYNVTIRAVDGAIASKRKTTEHVITVLNLPHDVNNGQLKFEKEVYLVDLPENDTIGTPVLTIRLIETTNAVRFFITEITNNRRVFDVHRVTGVLTTARVIDREVGSGFYSMTILAVEMGSDRKARRIGSAKVNVTVLDKNDSPPVFGNFSRSYTISEDSTIGHRLSRVPATDPDVTGVVKYSLKSGGDGKFIINEKTAEIELTNLVDREVKSEFYLTIEAFDGVQSAFVGIDVTVLDVNDNAPLFEQKIYSFDVSEDAPRGGSVGMVKARDADEGSGGEVSYAVVGDWDAEVFSLNPDSGVFTLTASIDYEQIKYYKLIIQAQDGQSPPLSSTVTVYFNIIDSNDNAPIFDPISYNQQIYENVTVGTSILRVTATDHDSGANGRVVYSLHPSHVNDPFTITPSDGTLTTKTSLDRETRSFYNLIVIATDQSTTDERLSTSVQVNVIIRDVNDNPPEFVSANSSWVVENAALNTVVMAVKAVDRDEGRNSYVEYSLLHQGVNEFPFVLGPVDGLLRVNGALDRETKSNYTLKIIARDRGTPVLSSTATVTVSILDENDNSPVFSPEKYSVSVPENSSVGASVVQVSASDGDGGVNGRLRYSIISGDNNRKFSIGEDSGIVRVAKELDYEMKNAYSLTIHVEDGGGDARHDTATVTVKIDDVNDCPPVFVDSPYYVRVMEGQDKGMSIKMTKITARDCDDPPNDQVRYFIKDAEHGNLFVINGTTGDVYVTQVLDRETRDEYVVNVIAMDSGSPRLTGLGTIYVQVDDVNDNDPVFDKTNYVTSVMENSPPDTHVTIVTATDVDLGVNAEITYTLKGEGSHHFKIDTSSGEVMTRVPLDHERQARYDLLLIARDSNPVNARHSMTSLTIHVGDVNDNAPAFDKEVYTVYVPDVIGNGQFVFGATAVDADSGVNGRVTYQLTGANKDKFIIDSVTGVTKTTSSLRGTDTYRVEVIAKDSGSPSASSSVTYEVVLRPWKNFPTFQSNGLTDVVVSELVGDRQILTTVLATSPKSGSASKVTYRLAGGNVGNVFSVDAQSGDVRVEGELDFESINQYELWVEARDADDPPMTSVQRINVNVTDANDNDPVFENEIYNASVMEEEFPPQIVVVTVTATDADSGRNGRLNYRLRSNDNNGAFTIDAKSGRISTNTRLDREEMDVHLLTIEAVDSGTPPKTGSATILISVLDKNDNPPRFTRLFSANVTENSKIGTFVIQVTSSDKDAETNANARYSFTENPGGKFKIDPVTGNVTVAGKIDREVADEYILKVSAVDGAWRAETPLTISVQDVNDNAPECQVPKHRFAFPEKQRAVTFAGRVSASDKDKIGPNSYLSYSLKQVSDAFDVDPSTGDVISKKILEYKHVRSPENQFNLVVVVSDHGKPSLSSECEVLVDVLSANEHSPVFVEKKTVIPVPSNIAIGTTIFTFEAVDKYDVGLNAEVTYRVAGGNGTRFFDVDTATGGLTVNALLESSKGMAYHLEIEAKDKGTPPKADKTSVMIVVTGDNQHAPQFSESGYQVIVHENEVLGSKIIVVTAKDQDDGINGQVTYRIESGNEGDAFVLDTSTGVVSILNQLDYENVKEYHLNISSTDASFESKSTFVVVTVVVTDVNDNAPMFTKSVYDAYVVENSAPKDVIFTVTATDADSGRNAAVHYSITGGDGRGVFVVEPQTGSILTTMSLDYEQKTDYEITVLASNPDSVQYTSTTIKIHVVGVNEFFPKFVEPSFEFVVSDTAEVGTVVGRVVATDGDAGVDGVVDYVLIGANADKGFSVESDTGVIKVTSKMSDFPIASKKLTLKITAKNHGPIRGEDIDEAEVVIMIEDGNDPPIFAERNYHVKVSEDVPLGYSVITVSASDGTDTDVTYSILSGNTDSAFRIDPRSGVVSTVKILDRETASNYNLTIGATDSETPPQTGTASIKIDVEDVNDNAPVIASENLVGRVLENQASGTTVMVLKATDADTSKNAGPFSYVMVDAGDKKKNTRLFNVDRQSGVVKTLVTLDREKMEKLSFVVEVTDSGKPPLTSRFTIEVLVDDVNDSPSETRNASVFVIGLHGVTYKTSIGNLHPNDVDVTNEFECSLMNKKEIRDGSMRLGEKCQLYCQNWKNETRSLLVVVGNDGKHPSVTSSFDVKIMTLANTSLTQLVDVKLKNTSSTTFVSSYYASFYHTLRRILGVRGRWGGIYGITQVDNDVHLFIGAHKSPQNVLGWKELVNILTMNIDELTTSLGGSIKIAIGYRPCQEMPCENNAKCEDSIILADDTSLQITDTPNLIVTTPAFHQKLTCKCPDGFKGLKCEHKLDPCVPNPCSANAKCTTTGRDFQCHCPPTRHGRQCEKTQTVSCNPNPCQNGGTCELVSTSNFHCTCASGFVGTSCEYTWRGFGPTSFMAFAPVSLTSDFSTSLVFSTYRSFGLLAYSYGNAVSGKSDYVALELITSHVKFSIGSTSPVSLTTNQKIKSGKWYRVTASKIGQYMSLAVTECTDEGINCDNCSPGDSKCWKETMIPTTTPNFNNQLFYIGGIRSADVILERPNQISSDSFTGCLMSVSVNQNSLDLTHPLASSGITNSCPALKEPCKKEICLKDDATWCRQGRLGYTCQCLNGLLASDCNQAFEPFSFTEDSYVELVTTELYRRYLLLPHLYQDDLPKRTKRDSRQRVQWLSLQFRTVYDNGFLLYVTSKTGYTFIQLRDGFLSYTSRSELGRITNHTISRLKVTDGEWHNVTLVRRWGSVSIALDNVESPVNASRLHNFMDPHVTKLTIAGTSDDIGVSNDITHGFRGCVSTLILNGHVQNIDHAGGLFEPTVHGKLSRGCVGAVQSQESAGTDPLGVGVVLVISFFVVLMLAIMVSFGVYRRRKLKREKIGGNSSHHTKSNGTALLTTGMGTNHWSNHQSEVNYGENGDTNVEETLRNQIHEMKKHREMEIPQRPDIIEREVVNKSPGITSYRTDECSLLADTRSHEMDAPEHYDLENASSIAPSDIDIVYHYKGYRDGNVRRYKTNPVPGFHKHNHSSLTPNPHPQFHPNNNRNSPHNRLLLNQSPATLQNQRESPNGLKATTPLARLSPSSELSQQTPRILTLQDISGRPLQSALLATSQGVNGVTNSERSLNSPVSQLSQSTGSIHSNMRKDGNKKGTIAIGLTEEEIERLNVRPRNSSLVSTLDAVSSSSDEDGGRSTSKKNKNKNKMAELLETNTELLENQDSSTDESGNDSFTCSEFEYDNNNYDRVCVGRNGGIGNNGGSDLGPGNMIFSKLAEEEHEDDDGDDMDASKNYDAFDSFHGSLSTLVASDDDLSQVYKPVNGVHHHLGWHYLLNWGPNFESLVGVFKDIAELPDSTNVDNKKCSEEYL